MNATKSTKQDFRVNPATGERVARTNRPASSRKGWIDIDIDGLAKLVEGKSKVFLLHELVSNAWDTDSGRVDVVLERLPGVPKAKLVVKDDHPEGFANLSHAFTMFAESEKKSNAAKRGRFNMGEKLVLALCTEAKITTTTGSVTFDAHGRRTDSRDRTEHGSVFEGTVAMTRGEYDAVCAEFRKVIAPKVRTDGFGVRRSDYAGAPGEVHVVGGLPLLTFFNGEPLPERTPLAVVQGVTLPTVIADNEGNLRRSSRQTTVEFYRPAEGEVASIYEMGIPVVETGDAFHINVLQKVPLTMERDNVPPAYLKLLRAIAVNQLHYAVDANESWVTEALCSNIIEKEATRAIITARFGENAVTYDPSDPQSNHQASAHEFNVVHGGNLPAEAWANVRFAEALRPAGKVFPTYSGFAPSEVVTEEQLTDGHRRVRELVKRLGKELCNVQVGVRFFHSPGASDIANYRRGDETDGDAVAKTGVLGFNLAHLKPEWFGDPWNPNTPYLYQGLGEVLDLIVHELGHHYESSHLSINYHNAITRIAGKLAVLALAKPDVFR